MQSHVLDAHREGGATSLTRKGSIEGRGTKHLKRFLVGGEGTQVPQCDKKRGASRKKRNPHLKSMGERAMKERRKAAGQTANRDAARGKSSELVSAADLREKGESEL